MPRFRIKLTNENNVLAGSVPSGGVDDDDDDVPELVEDFEAASKTETGE